MSEKINLVPFLKMEMKKSKIEKNTHNNIILTIVLKNVGKDVANNIMLVSTEKGKNKYFTTESGLTDNLYKIYEYLDDTTLGEKESTSFSILRKNDKTFPLVDELTFKIRFTNPIGTLFEQEFTFGYDETMFSLKHTNKNPHLIK